jgi:type IV fimbrial biogenesis protein FimT
MSTLTQAPQRGVTLVEMATVTAVAAVLVGTVVPSFQQAQQRRQLEGVAAQLETDLQLARSEAVARNESVRVAFVNDASGSCYVLHTGPAGGCRCDGAGTTTCTDAAQALRSVPLAAGHPVQLESRTASMLFDAVKGTVTPTATVRVRSPAGDLRQVVNVMGRIRTCSPGGALAGYRPC